MRSRKMIGIILVSLGIGAPLATGRADMNNYYVYQRGQLVPRGTGGMEWASVIGTREARPFGNEGLEQRVGASYGLTNRVSAEGWGGALITESEVKYGVAGEVTVGVLRQEDQGLNLSVGVGYLMDYQDAPVPRVRITAGRDYGSWNTVGAALVEVPQAEDRDEVDIILAGAVSYPLNARSRLGAELIAEDLEGYWEEEEAEGGAKLIVGPTLWVSLNQGLELKANASAVISLTSNPPTRVAPNVPPPNSAGFQCGLVMVYLF